MADKKGNIGGLLGGIAALIVALTGLIALLLPYFNKPINQQPSPSISSPVVEPIQTVTSTEDTNVRKVLDDSNKVKSTLTSEDLIGQWSITQRSFRGVLEFYNSKQGLQARVRYNRNSWQPITDLALEKNTIKFYRPSHEQQFIGTVSGREIRGTFTGKTSTYSWSAIKQ